MKNKKIIMSLVCALLPATSSAAAIMWNPSVDLVAGGADSSDFISDNGAFVVGFNAGDGPAATTIGDSVFTSATSAALTNGITSNGVTVTGVQGNGFDGFASGDVTNTDVGALIGSALFNGTSVSFAGLTIGNTYEIQVLVNDARGGTGAGIRDVDWQVAFTDGADDTTIAGTANLSNRPLNDATDPRLAGDFIIGTFIADAASQSFNYAGTRAGFTVGDAFANPSGGQAQINALQLRDITAPIPEPSSTALLGLGGLALLLRRKK